MYSDTFGSFDIDEFAMRLWGNIYYDSEKRKFTRKAADLDAKRSFVHFILEPLYKLYTQVCLLSIPDSRDLTDVQGAERGLGQVEGDACRSSNHLEGVCIQDGCEAVVEGCARGILWTQCRAGRHDHAVCSFAPGECRIEGKLGYL